MGLDWVPLNKPKPGHEAEFEDLFLRLTGRRRDPAPFWKKALGLSKPESKENLSERFLAIPAITPYETLGAPMVGRDASADAWVRNLHDTKKLAEPLLALPVDEVVKKMEGFFVVDLVPPCDGIPVYMSGPGGNGYNPESFWFRGKFLQLCTDALPKALIEEAFVSKLAPELVDYGTRLRQAADKFARAKSVEHALTERRLEWEDESQPEAQAHIVASAARWCAFWGERGHGLEANF